MSLLNGLVKVAFKSGEEGHVLPEEVPGLKKAGLLKEEKQPGKTKEEKSTGQTKEAKPQVKKISGTAKRVKPRPANISHANIKGASPKKT